MEKPNIEGARAILNEWEHRAANDPDNQTYIQAWADNSSWTFVEIYAFLVNEEKAGFLEAWGFSPHEPWEIQAAETRMHRALGGEGRPIALAELPGFAFAPTQFEGR